MKLCLIFALVLMVAIVLNTLMYMVALYADGEHFQRVRDELRPEGTDERKGLDPTVFRQNMQGLASPRRGWQRAKSGQCTRLSRPG